MATKLADDTVAIAARMKEIEAETQARIAGTPEPVPGFTDPLGYVSKNSDADGDVGVKPASWECPACGSPRRSLVKVYPNGIDEFACLGCARHFQHVPGFAAVPVYDPGHDGYKGSGAVKPSGVVLNVNDARAEAAMRKAFEDERTIRIAEAQLARKRLSELQKAEWDRHSKAAFERHHADVRRELREPLRAEVIAEVQRLIANPPPLCKGDEAPEILFPFSGVIVT